ncbi:hypothetical protein P8625_14295 [Tenacibaculum tangerinum]|uniref:PAS domain-containing protein n=1 Tax=Tenacibaculum tangerinum TaxID=3038772 RepID=A0ABY8L3M2_9FLAO|nr:hypothetical protein [Tenacibaculum tangerinum]WGH75227.1 hypothetical protein P8625_14295 [Tenacibaculum tangerinum]
MTNISENERKQTANYLETIKAFARTTYKSIYVIDYEKKGFEYVSENPLFLCGHTAEEVQEMVYLFYFNYVIPEDVELLLKINCRLTEKQDSYKFEFTNFKFKLSL